MRQVLWGAAALVGFAMVNPAVAGAELDMGAYDACMQDTDRRVMAGEIGTMDVVYSMQYCCVKAGGRPASDNPTEANCASRPADVASSPSAAPPPSAAAPDVPTSAPSSTSTPTKAPKTTFTPGPLLPNLGN